MYMWNYLKHCKELRPHTSAMSQHLVLKVEEQKLPILPNKHLDCWRKPMVRFQKFECFESRCCHNYFLHLLLILLRKYLSLRRKIGDLLSMNSRIKRHFCESPSFFLQYFHWRLWISLYTELSRWCKVFHPCPRWSWALVCLQFRQFTSVFWCHHLDVVLRISRV